MMVMMWVGGGGAGDQSTASSASYRIVLSVSKSQSLGRGSVQEETATSCCSTASSGTKARLSPLKDIAESKEEAKIKKKSHSEKFLKLLFCHKTA